MEDLTQTISREVEGVPVTRMSDVDFPPRVYDPIKTGRNVYDDFFSTKGGVPKASIVLVGGMAGTGKTTLMCETLGNAEKNGKRTLFISGEMDDIRFNEYSQRFPKFGNFDTYFPTVDRNIVEDLQALYGYGYDLILVDSFKEVKERISEQCDSTKTWAEQFLIDLFKDVKNGVKTSRPNPEHEVVYTTTIAIQQMTSAGDFAGSEALKHQVTSALKLFKESEQECYLMFEKNRCGETHRKLYYTIDGSELSFNEERKEREEEAVDFVENEKERQENEGYDTLDDLVDDENQKEENSDTGEEWPSTWNDTELSNFEHRKKVKEIFENENENRRASMRRCKGSGLFGEDQSYHYFRKMLHEYNLDHYPNY